MVVKESIMQRWDKIRELLLWGHKGSQPRDIFENILEDYEEEIIALEAELTRFKGTKGVTNLQKIVEDWLSKHRYDGLYNPDEECGCLVSDGVLPCECPHEFKCKPGVIVDFDKEGTPLIGPEK